MFEMTTQEENEDRAPSVGGFLIFIGFFAVLVLSGPHLVKAAEVYARGGR